MDTTIGENIVATRQVLGHSQTELSRKSGISQSTLSSIENSQRNPSFAMVLRVKRALGCSWAALLRGIE